VSIQNGHKPKLGQSTKIANIEPCDPGEKTKRSKVSRGIWGNPLKRSDHRFFVLGVDARGSSGVRKVVYKGPFRLKLRKYKRPTNEKK